MRFAPTKIANRFHIGRQYAAVLAAALCTPSAIGSPTVEALAAQESIRVSGTDVVFRLQSIPSGIIEIDGTTHTIADIAVSTTEVTWDLYDIYLFALDKPEADKNSDGVSRPSKPYVPPDRGYGHAGYPAMGMTRLAAVRFCEWLSKKTGETYRLPTRAEWIYLTEAGAGRVLSGSAATAWHEENSAYSTHPVGKKAPNDWGLHDTLGNVAEWIAPEPTRRAQEVPIAMGGSFLEPVLRCTTRAAMTQEPYWNSSDPQIPKSRWWLADCDFVGFRIVRDSSSSRDEPSEQTPAQQREDR